MPLLERHHELELLGVALSEAAEGTGRVAVVSAEAGGGKTALIDAFIADASSVRPPPRVLRGACADLSTPLPFGPLLDVARDADPGLERALEEGNREQAVNRLLDLVERRPHPVILVVEDVHWIDQASADALTVIVERIDQLSALLVLTHRIEELVDDHPARRLLWRLPPAAAIRIEPAPLSRDAIARLAPPGVDADAVAAASGGNPFFVTELLAAGGGLPPSLREAVLSRVAALPAGARPVLELTSIVPGGIDARILDAVYPGWEVVVEPAEARRIVDVTPTGVAFHHDLARQAVESALLTSRRRRLHATVLEVIRPTAPPGTVMHHAVNAGDVATILQVAPIAAEEARAAGSHREAAAHLRRVLDHADLLSPERRAELEEWYTVEAWTIHHPEESEAAARRALAIRRAAGDTDAVGRNLRRIARVRWFLGRGDEAEELLDEAIGAQGKRGSAAERAVTLAYRTLIAGIRHSGEAARRWGDEAIALVNEIDDPAVRALVLNDVGTIDFQHGGSPDRLLASIELAEKSELHSDVVRGHINLAVGAVHRREYDFARTHLEEAASYASRHQVAAFMGLLSATRAQVAFETGDWDEAERLAEEVLGQPSFARLPALITLARLQVRRGDTDAPVVLEEALRLAAETGEAQRMVPAVGAAAEQAWMLGKLDDLVPTLRIAHDLAVQSGSPRWIGETSNWLYIARRLDSIPSEAEDGARFVATAAWDQAARFWEERGVMFEAAVARGLSGIEELMLDGLATLDRMGAVPMAKVVRNRLKQIGVERIPRGPRRTTRSNPVGLTARQVDVMRLVMDDLTNSEIADRLYLSTRTVDHHVAAILLKLGVSSRKDVADRARELELT